jgi:dipeptidyl aminopeptidase/acylaminoacyl peptidase
VTDVEGGIGDWSWSPDGSRLAWLAGRDAERQIWVTDGDGDDEPRRLTSHSTPIHSFEWRSSSEGILFVAPDDWDAADAERRRKGFRARTIQRGLAHDDFIELSAAHVWSVDVEGGPARRVTEGPLRVMEFEESPGGERIALIAGPLDPYRDNRANEVYEVDPGAGGMKRLTENDVEEQIIGYSPDGSLLAVTAPSRFEGSVDDIFVRAASGGDWRALTADFDNDINAATWTEDGRGFHFAGADGVNGQLFRVDVDGGEVMALTSVEGVISLASDHPGPTAVIEFTDPRSPADLYAAAWEHVGDRLRWTRLTRANPWVDSIQLADYETVRWRSRDGTEVEGLVIYPLDYDPSRSYPLITDIHGGPASAYQNTFDPTTGRPQRGYMHLMAAHGYAVLRPNYRGSSNYGERFKAEISGDYWTRATEDIHAGVDLLIARGLAHPDSLGFMGWSAGGHWSNWMLVTSDRFKAISSGAGVANWISLYGQTDAQASREFYLGGDNSLDAPNRPWDDFDHWWDESPIRYIHNASTPTLIHFGQADERIPMPQGQELHMALKHRGVPTEFIVYPDEPHGLREPTNQLVKIMSEMGWFEKWIRGADSWLDWADVLEVAASIEEALAPAGTEGDENVISRPPGDR